VLYNAVTVTKMKIAEQTITDFLTDVASSKPAPGGGAVAAVTGALAASLVEMVCNLTLGRKNYEEVEDQVRDIQIRVSEIKSLLMDAADADTEAFGKVMEAYKTDDKDKIKAALFWSTEIPEKVAGWSEEVRQLALEIAEIGNKSAKSDAMSAEYLATSALEAAQENIEINKKSLAALKQD